MKQAEDTKTVDMFEEDEMKQVWNYRIVNFKSENDGEDWYCLQEVCYDMDGRPTGYATPCTGSESMDGMRNVWHMMAEAMQLPALQEEDFK